MPLLVIVRMTASLKAALFRCCFMTSAVLSFFKFLKWGISQHIIFSVVPRKVVQEMVEDVAVEVTHVFGVKVV